MRPVRCRLAPPPPSQKKSVKSPTLCPARRILLSNGISALQARCPAIPLAQPVFSRAFRPFARKITLNALCPRVRTLRSPLHASNGILNCRLLRFALQIKSDGFSNTSRGLSESCIYSGHYQPAGKFIDDKRDDYVRPSRCKARP